MGHGGGGGGGVGGELLGSQILNRLNFHLVLYSQSMGYFRGTLHVHANKKTMGVFF